MLNKFSVISYLVEKYLRNGVPLVRAPVKLLSAPSARQGGFATFLYVTINMISILSHIYNILLCIILTVFAINVTLQCSESMPSWGCQIGTNPGLESIPSAKKLFLGWGGATQTKLNFSQGFWNLIKRSIYPLWPWEPHSQSEPPTVWFRWSPLLIMILLYGITSYSRFSRPRKHHCMKRGWRARLVPRVVELRAGLEPKKNFPSFLPTL